MATPREVELIRSHNKVVRVRATLLDENYKEVDNLTGTIKASPAYDISSESDIRRTSSITMIVDKDKLNTDFEKTWIQRMVELSIGVYDRIEDKYIWYSLGRMLMRDSNMTYSLSTREIKMSLVDLMATMTTARGSQMGLSMKVPAGSNVRNAIIAIVTTFSPFKKYSVPEFEDTVPYDIEVAIGQYPFDALKELMNLFPYYEMFYDVDGTFTVQQIPTKIGDPVDVDKSIVDELLISEKRTVNFSDVRNTTEIWGRSLDANYTALKCTSDGATYKLDIDETFKTLEEGHTYGFTPDKTSAEGQKIKIQDTDELQIYVESGVGLYTPISVGAMEAGVPYVVRYVNDKFVLQGELEIHVIYQEVNELPSLATQENFKRVNGCRNVQWNVNPESPFACSLEPTTGAIERELRQVLEGGEYNNIYTTQLALERASYENWLKTRLQDTVELEMVLIPWMEVNDKIEYTSPSSGEVMTMLVQSISYDLARWTMTVKCSKFYPYYPWW